MSPPCIYTFDACAYPLCAQNGALGCNAVGHMGKQAGDGDGMEALNAKWYATRERVEQEKREKP